MGPFRFNFCRFDWTQSACLIRPRSASTRIGIHLIYNAGVAAAQVGDATTLAEWPFASWLHIPHLGNRLKRHPDVQFAGPMSQPRDKQTSHRPGARKPDQPLWESVVVVGSMAGGSNNGSVEATRNGCDNGNRRRRRRRRRAAMLCFRSVHKWIWLNAFHPLSLHVCVSLCVCLRAHIFFSIEIPLLQLLLPLL